MAFRSIHTLAGLAALALAEATGTPINLTHMAVGDGNGNPVSPVEAQTNLVREMFRAPVNRVFQSPSELNRFTAELLIPASEGGFTLREVGIFTAAGTLFAVGNLPDTYKPQASEGAFSDTVIRMEFVVTNADVITLQIDPNVAVATQAWVVNNVQGVPGGNTGQALIKHSNASFDADWQNLADLNVVVEIIEETQTLAAAQTVVNLTLTTTNSLAVYVAGLRLRPDQWTPHPTIETRLTLAQPYAADTKLVAVQNEPSGDVGVPLLRSSNLADVPDKPQARINLDVFSREETRQMAPAGQVSHFARSTAPVGWLKANGAAISRTAYADLFAAIGTTFGAGNGTNTFNLPDLRGEFLRSWDDGRGVDASRTLGSAQADQNKTHTHAASTNTAGSHTHSGTTSSDGAHSHTTEDWAANFTRMSNNTVGGAGAIITDIQGGNRTQSTSAAATHSHTISTGSGGNHAHTVTVTADGGAEARPRNVALLVCIKF